MEAAAPPERPATARLFFALWPDDNLREALVRSLRPWRESLAARWVRPEHYHITLAFLGAVPVARIELLMELAAPLPLAPFELTLQRMEFWPRPRVLCLTSAQVPEPLAGLVAAIDGVVGRLALPVERRPYRPHLTVARKVRQEPPAAAMEPLVWPVRNFCLAESRTSAEGPVYKVLRRFGG